MAVDTRELDEFFARLESPQRDEVTMKGLHKYAEKLKELTLQRLVQKMGNAAQRPRVRNGKSSKPMVKGVKITDDKQLATVIVSILKEFRLKYFELGTQERYLKRTGAKDREAGYRTSDKRKLFRKEGKENFYRAGSYRGKIEPIHFFKEARQEISEEELVELIDNELSKYLKL